MWIFMIAAVRMLTRLLRRFGRWALLAPAVAVVAALFGLGVWTAGTVLLALFLAVLLALFLTGRRPATAGLLPVTMLGAGVCGLWAAATVVGSRAAGPFALWSPRSVVAVAGRSVVAVAGRVPPPPPGTGFTAVPAGGRFVSAGLRSRPGCRSGRSRSAPATRCSVDSGSPGRISPSSGTACGGGAC